jgi:hypothetical protein
MANAGRVGLGTLQGATGGAGLGTAILPGWGTAIGAGVGGVAGLIGGLVDDTEDEQEKKRKQALAMLDKQHAYEFDQGRFNDDVAFGQRLGADPIFMNDKKRGLQARGQALERERLNANMAPQDQDPGWQEWVGPLLGAGAAAAGAFKSDPLAARRAQLNSTSDEADFIRSQNLTAPQLRTALEENDERTKSALFGARTRMSPYDF